MSDQDLRHPLSRRLILAHYAVSEATYRKHLLAVYALLRRIQKKGWEPKLQSEVLDYIKVLEQEK